MDTTPEKVLPGMGIFLGFITFVSVGLLLLVPVQTSASPPNQGWWTHPALMPTFSLVFFAATSVWLFVQHNRTAQKHGVQNDRATVSAELIEWAKPLEFFIYYFLYIWLLGMIGYFLSSAIFAVGVGMRVGLRSRRWIYTGIFFALALTAMFRWGLSIWFPAPWLFEQLPSGLRIFFIRNF
ncbi:MAG: tripartite tricarboxylate transporter TctB family protein [Candidatus Promineifilaceae bacterium]